MAGPDTGSLRRRIAELEENKGYGGDDPGELYLRMLKDASPYADDYPGAAEEYLRRNKLAYLREQIQDARRSERYSGDE